MSDESPCIIGVQSCGCITYANARPDDLNKSDMQAINQIVRSGGTIDRTTVEAARVRPDFFPFECPHDPQGWGPKRKRKKAAKQASLPGVSA